MRPANVLQIQPLALKKQLDEGEDICLVDVRENWEHSLASIPGSTHIPLGELVDRVQEFFFEENIVVYCHVGERSYRGAMILIPPVGFIPRSLLRFLNENFFRIPRPLAAGSFIGVGIQKRSQPGGRHRWLVAGG